MIHCLGDNMSICSMNKSIHLCPDAVEEVIRAAERDIGYKMLLDDFTFLRDCICTFSELAIHKFVVGCKHHTDDGGPFVSSVNHKAEMEKEVIDFLFYFWAQQKKEQKK